MSSELKDLIAFVQKTKAESDHLEVKAAHVDCPKRLYDTLSSFSNRDDGGIILFGLDENQNFEKVGVYDAQDLLKRVTEQCKQMDPPVRPLLTLYHENEMTFVAAEIPAIDLSLRPCYYKGKGILKGSYIRVGDADEPMTEYEVYSYEAYRKKYADDIRPIERATFSVLDKNLLERYVVKLTANKPNLSQLSPDQIHELMSITRNREVTLSALLLFCPYPQAFCPQLGIIATFLPGMEMSDEGLDGERFLDNKRIDGNIPQMLDDTLSFINKNMRIKTIIDNATGHRKDIPEYPLAAVRECILNALVHRDYSMHTEGMPIQVRMFKNRLEVINPGGLYGRITIDQLGKVQPDTRNPVLANAMEILGLTENRYSGIPAIYRAMRQAGLPEPQFADERGCFFVTLYNNYRDDATTGHSIQDQLLAFCQTPRSRSEIAAFLKISSLTYAIQQYILPLVKTGQIKMSIPDKPGSRNQRFFVSQKIGG